MAEMKQYIDFFKTQRKQIDASCSSLVNSYRDEAFASFEETGFPIFKSEEYQHTNIAELLDTDFGFYLNYKGESIDPHKLFHCNIPNLSSSPHFIINGHFYKEKNNRNLPDKVFSGSLNTFAEEYPDIFSKYYNKLAEEKGNGLTALNTMFVQDGYVLYVPKNIIIDHPIQLTNIFNGKIDALINRRILIIIEAGSQAKILICDHSTEKEPLYAATQITEIFVEENAVLDFYELEESSKRTIRLADNFVQQSTSSNVMINNITLNNGVTRNNYYIDLDGEFAETYLYGMAIVDDTQKIDNHSVIFHNVPNCQSNELFKYVLDEQSLGVFSGKIIVAENAQKTQAYQNNKNLLGSKECKMYSKPQLIINADDVKCSHGMTTGQLDESALFYMRSRGIPKEEAILLLKYAFTDDVIQGIRLDTLKERLKMLIEKRFRGELIRCQECI
ncbi:MAG: Fe-S cluster assembly protein SufD [Bacteroidales bacterium]|nr:Fe-S cluster assembly protein SufD [Bacteroidales bacterium]